MIEKRANISVRLQEYLTLTRNRMFVPKDVNLNVLVVVDVVADIRNRLTCFQYPFFLFYIF